MRKLVIAVLGLLAFGCGGDVLPPAPPPPPALVPAALAILSRNGQEGAWGEFLAEPFMVRVTSAEGSGIAKVPVSWSIVVGSGAFGIGNTVTQTNADGVAWMFFQPKTTGGIEVHAELAGVQGSPAVFTVDVPTPVVVIPFGPIFDCYGTPINNDPSLFDDPKDPLPVGTTVGWVYAPYLLPGCAARLVSRSVPPGGLPFDSGMLGPGERFTFVFTVAGDWVYDDVINGGTGLIKIR